MRVDSCSSGIDIGVVALSARALVSAAKRAGLRAAAFDLFMDLDTRTLASKAIRIRRGKGLSFNPEDLKRQLGKHLPDGVPLLLGSGFEAQPKLLGELQRRFALLGNGHDTILALKEPFEFARLLHTLRIRHPRLFLTLDEAAGFAERVVQKKAGASGGAHVIQAEARLPTGSYLQELVKGRSVSALFLADGSSATVIGMSEQWASPDGCRKFRYGGALGPFTLEHRLYSRIAGALERIAAATGLVGLNSADFVLDPDDFWLLEINPRPSATLDVFDHLPMPPLLRLHIDACGGVLPQRLPEVLEFRAAEVLYAREPVVVPEWNWPGWTADRPAAGTRIQAGAPVCTIMASGVSMASTKEVLKTRTTLVRRRLGMRSSKPGRGRAAA